MKAEATLGIACVMKNEAPYIIEWLAHHRLLGIRNFFIANNDSTDETTDLLDALQRAGLVIHHRFPTPKIGKPHVPAFQMLIDKHRNDVEWLAMIDADEFLTPSSEDFRIHHFLDTFSHQHPTVGAIAINWATYGSSGHRFFEPQPLAQRFTKHATLHCEINQNYKSIVKTCAVNQVLTPHHIALNSSAHYRHADGTALIHPSDPSIPALIRECRSQQISWEPLRINHYIIKSYQEFVQRKTQRGRAFTNYPLDNRFFLGHDINLETTKPSPIYLQALSNEILALEEALESTGLDIKKIQNTTPDSLSEKWSTPQAGSIDSIEFMEDGRIRLYGWTLPWISESTASIKARINYSDWLTPVSFSPILRDDVLKYYPSAPKDCGFIAYIDPPHNLSSIESLEIRAITRDGLTTEPIDHGAQVVELLAKQGNEI